MQKNGWNQSKFLIDGFPRNEDNCEGFDRILGKDVHMPFMIFLDCSKETMISRIQKRARETDGQRNDDNTEVLIKRFDTFQQQTLPVLKKYQLSNQARIIDANRSAPEVTKSVVDLLREEKYI